MAIANPLTGGSKNTVKIYDKDVQTTGWNRIVLTKEVSCQVLVVFIDGVFICHDYTLFYFELPCMPIGNYKLEFYETGALLPTYSLPAIIY